MQIVVVGAGALGALYAGLLVESGARVSVLARPERVAELRTRGIVIHSEVEGRLERRIFHCQVVGHAEELPNADLVLLTPKLYDLAHACSKVSACCSARTAVLTVQNGIDAPTIVSQTIPGVTVLAGKTFVIARGNGVPGEVVYSTSDQTITFGAWSSGDSAVGAHGRAVAVGDFLRGHGVPAIVTETARAEIWVKYVWFCAYSGVAAGYGLSQGAIAADPARYALLFDAVQEGLLIAQAEGVTLPADQSEQYRERMRRTVSRTPGTTPTLLRDLELGGRTEIDFLAGKMISMGEKHKIATPAFRTIFAAVCARADSFRRA